MAKKAKPAESVPLSAAEEASLDAVSLDALEAAVDGGVALGDAPPDEGREPPAPPMSSPDWHGYVMKQFQPDEVDREGNPYVHGLRRVARLLLGPILSSKTRVVSPPTYVPGLEDRNVLQPAVVEHAVVFQWAQVEPGEASYQVEIADVADAWASNVDPAFARYLTAQAATRAEGRVYRKALQLKRVVTAEEITLVPLEESGAGGFIGPSGINFINAMAARCDISVKAFINSGKNTYEKIDDVPYQTAVAMCKKISGYQNRPETIPEAIKGYEKNWRK